MAVVVVKRTGRTWGVFVDDRLVEGGFFTRAAASECAENWRTGKDTGTYSGGYRTFRNGTCREDFGSDR
jgi:hypothetical protein